MGHFVKITAMFRSRPLFVDLSPIIDASLELMIGV